MGMLCPHEKKNPFLLGNEQGLWWRVHVGRVLQVCPPSPQHRYPPEEPQNGSEAFLAHGVLGVGTGPSLREAGQNAP